jgi:hypothetical protein
LAELSQALDAAQELVWRFGGLGVGETEALDLSARLAATLAEVRSLRLARITQDPTQTDPEWTSSGVWDPPSNRTD